MDAKLHFENQILGAERSLRALAERSASAREKRGSLHTLERALNTMAADGLLDTSERKALAAAMQQLGLDADVEGDTAAVRDAIAFAVDDARSQTKEDLPDLAFQMQQELGQINHAVEFLSALNKRQDETYRTVVNNLR